MTMKSHGMFNLSDSKLHDLVMNHCDGAHLKDADTGKYILVNQYSADAIGLTTPNEIVGLTAKDLEKKMMKKFWKDYIKKIQRLDRQAIKSGQVVHNNNDILLNAFDKIRIQNMVKIPFKGKNNKVHSICTIAYDISKNIDLFQLWGMYKKTHKNLKDAIKHFFDHIGVDEDLFSKTVKEKHVISVLDLIKKHAGCD